MTVKKPPKQTRGEEFVEEIEAGAIVTWQDAFRFGIKPSSLAKSLQRAGRPDLVKRLGGYYATKKYDAHTK